MTRHKQSCGQAYVITILFLAVLLAMAAAVLDIGSWYRADRSLQATVDAAALAGAQALPDGTASASTLASQYAAKNGGGTMSITFESQVFPNDTITVSGSRPAPGFFSKMLGIKSVTVHATASARAGYPTQAKWVVPIVVDEKHPKLQCNPNPCSGQTQLVYQHLKNNGSPDGSGNFGFINLTGGSSGTSDLGNLIDNGWDQYMDLGDYDAITGNMFSSSQHRRQAGGADRRRSALPDLPQDHRKRHRREVPDRGLGRLPAQRTRSPRHERDSPRRVRECHVGRHSSRKG